MDIYSLWSVSDDRPVLPSVILAHGYGITLSDSLPDPAIKVLDLSISLHKQFQIPIWLGDSNYFWRPAEFEGGLKDVYLHKMGVDFDRVKHLNVSSTIDEIDRAVEYLASDIQNYEIISVCDRIHARRIKAFWKRLYPEARVKIVTVDGSWTREMPSRLQSSKLWWLVGNVIHLLLFKVFGRLSNKLTHHLTLKK